ncbi:hypothetical protein HK099_000438 [Clydaea vesicula]|uniref:Ubiquitin-like domain-containing protein n=1 Tax=Clydaea vesicula TaxID=447962 RepID=A0AAD5UBJ4_9FUNG|nr:hypothetical protein HK099_000438 [Clydaea vesicula]
MEEYTINLKSFSTPGDYQIAVPKEAQVYNLKLKIQLTFPNNPLVANQRLIFQGKLLNDELLLKDLLSNKIEEGMNPTFHLVIKNEPYFSVSNVPGASIKGKENSANHKESSGEKETVVNAATQNTTLNQQQQFVNTTPSFNPFLQQFQFHYPYQMVIINGMPYLMQIPPQYNQQQSSQSNQSSFIQQQFSQFSNQNLLQQQVPIVDNNPPQPEVRNQPPPVVVPPPIDDEFGDNERNQPQNPLWLLMKLSFLVYIFSQNASYFRVIVLYVSALIIFLVQTRWIPILPLRRIGVPVNNDNGVANNPRGNNDAPFINNERQLTFLGKVRSFIFTFVSSLIP